MPHKPWATIRNEMPKPSMMAATIVHPAEKGMEKSLPASTCTINKVSAIKPTTKKVQPSSKIAAM